MEKKIKLTSVLLVIGTALLLFSSYNPLSGQELSPDKQLDIVLSDGTPVKLFGSSASTSNEYFYLLPSNALKLVETEKGTPSFQYINYQNEQQKAEGALLYLILEANLSAAQLEELGAKLSQATDTRGKIAGPVKLELAPGNSFGLYTLASSMNSSSNSC